MFRNQSPAFVTSARQLLGLRKEYEFGYGRQSLPVSLRQSIGKSASRSKVEVPVIRNETLAKKVLGNHPDVTAVLARLKNPSLTTLTATFFETN